MSHELRTPLSNILTWSRILRDAGLEDPQCREAVEVIARNAESQRRLIDDLLDTTRIASGKLRLNPGPFDPAEAARAVLRSITPTAQTRGVQLAQDIQDALGEIIGDAGRFEQIVWNLLNNAVKFTPAGGTVRLSLRAQGPMLVLEVADTGRGIAPEFLASLFTPFTQAPEKRGVGKAGLGLGLSIVKSLVELHNGTVSAESPGEGRGATFTVRLPLVREAAGRAPEPPAGSGPLAGVRVLLAEDNPDAQRAIKRVLETAGAEVDAVSNGRAALELFNQDRPTLIVSDLSMPEMDGFGFLQAVRAAETERGTARTPAIALSAHTSGADRAAAAEAGFDRFLPKPFEPAALIAEAAGVARPSNSPG
jgi:CheY-like chemotaxis protein